MRTRILILGAICTCSLVILALRYHSFEGFNRENGQPRPRAFANLAGQPIDISVQWNDTLAGTSGTKPIEKSIGVPRLTAKLDRDRYGVVDDEGKVVIAFQYEEIGNYSAICGVLPVKLKGKWGAVDLTGKEMIPCEWDNLQFVNSGRFAFASRAGVIGTIRQTGEFISPLSFDEVRPTAHRNPSNLSQIAYFVSKRKKNHTVHGIIDLFGRLIVPIEFDFLSVDDPKHPRFITARQGDEEFTIDLKELIPSQSAYWELTQ